MLPSASHAAVDLTTKRTWRSTKSQLMTGLMVVSVLAALVPIVLVVVNILGRGIHQLSWDFLTKPIPTVKRRIGPGMGPAVVGTIVVTTLAAAMAVPLGILGAVYLHEYGGRSRFARLVRLLSNVMTGVPSIVMGLFVYTLWTLHHGLAGLGGSFALACLMLPIVIRSTEEMLRLVPSHLREASLALGSSKSRTILTVVLPAALPGITSGVLLAVARAAGETAPVLFTVGVITRKANWNPFSGPNTTLSYQIFDNAKSPFAGAQGRAFGAALTLVLLTFLLTLVARLVAARFALKR